MNNAIKKLILVSILISIACSNGDDDDSLICGLGTHQVGDRCLADSHPDDDDDVAPPNDDEDPPLPVDDDDDDDAIDDDDDTPTDPIRNCGPGTIEVNGECLPQTICGADTLEIDGECVPNYPEIECGDDTELIQGRCVSTVDPYAPEAHDLTGRWHFFSHSQSLEVITLCIYNDFYINLYIPDWFDIEKDGEGGYVFSSLPLNQLEADGSFTDWVQPVGGALAANNRVTATASKGYVDAEGDLFLLSGSTTGFYFPEDDTMALESYLLVYGPGDFSEVCLMEMRSSYERR